MCQSTLLTSLGTTLCHHTTSWPETFPVSPMITHQTYSLPFLWDCQGSSQPPYFSSFLNLFGLALPIKIFTFILYTNLNIWNSMQICSLFYAYIHSKYLVMYYFALDYSSQGNCKCPMCLIPQDISAPHLPHSESSMYVRLIMMDKNIVWK